MRPGTMMKETESFPLPLPKKLPRPGKKDAGR